MNKKNQIIATAAFTGLLALSPAFAQNQLSSQDRKFVMDAAVGGMMEVEMGRMAAQKAANADVKAFGQRMVTDHGKANDQLKQLASQLGVTLPTTLPADKRQEMEKITRLSGAEFDRMYMSHMVKDHKKDISEFDKQASKGDNDSLQSFARSTLPTLREHYKMAQDVGTKVGAPMDHSDHKMDHGKH